MLVGWCLCEGVAPRRIEMAGGMGMDGSDLRVVSLMELVGEAALISLLPAQRQDQATLEAGSGGSSPKGPSRGQTKSGASRGGGEGLVVGEHVEFPRSDGQGRAFGVLVDFLIWVCEPRSGEARTGVDESSVLVVGG